mmetsp:Transcript_39362/g.61362  ORF Transcript_39362/g.61362 Transcript_39362/m.61362 type:complete len:190 (+) Transcript_39362:275-844(+)
MTDFLKKCYQVDLGISTVCFKLFGPGEGGLMGEKAARLLWESVSVTGDGFFWFGLVPIGYMATKSWDPKSLLSMEARLIVSILVIDIGTIVVLKYLFRRERPPHHKKDFRFVGPDVHSFPSGHSTRVWSVAYGLRTLIYFNSSFTEQSTVDPWIVVWASIVSLGRVALGRHYVSPEPFIPSDFSFPCFY